MNAVDIIAKKRDGEELTREEIRFFIDGFTRGDIPDYQASAWAMAVLLRGMTPAETFDLTEVMVESGGKVDLSGVVDVVVDKHSTGGVGDKTTLVVEPIIAASGVRVGKMSGRGLSFTGGTLDKMESIPGYQAEISGDQFVQQLKEVGLVLSGQTADLAPADGKLYALRDVTGTVPSIPLIASSIMSKKLAGGAHAVVLDVKVGLGAFMQSLEEASQLAHLMVEIGERSGRRMVALLSDMNQPLGHAVGNALELKEALNTLLGSGPRDFYEHCMKVAGHLLVLARRAETLEAGKRIASDELESGRALDKFKALISAQGGEVRVIEDPHLLPRAAYVQTVGAPASGYLQTVHAREVGLTVVQLGGGRKKKGEEIDHAVGVVVHHKVGDRLEQGEPLFTVHANREADGEAAVERMLSAHKITTQEVDPLPLFYETISGEGYLRPA